MLGSILSNILLVMGCCFIAGGYNRVQQKLPNQTVAQTMASLMALSVLSLLIPAAYNAGYPGEFEHILDLSRGASVVLLAIYGLYLFSSSTPMPTTLSNKTLRPWMLRLLQPSYTGLPGEDGDVAVEEIHESTLSTGEALVLLTLVTVAVSYCADYLVDSIDDIVSETGVSKTFIGLILIPIVGNAAEHVTAVVVAMKDKMDLAVGVAIGSSMQIALFLTPFLVILGWIVGQPMSLLFSTFETCVLFVSVMILTYIVADGESNWLEGCMLIGTYIIISISFFYTP